MNTSSIVNKIRTFISSHNAWYCPCFKTTILVFNIYCNFITRNKKTRYLHHCKLTKLNEIVIEHKVKIIGYADFPSKLSQDASNLYANNLLVNDTIIYLEFDLLLTWICTNKSPLRICSLARHAGEFSEISDISW